MIEQIVIAYLTAALPGIPVSGEIPPDPPRQFITVERTGGDEDEHVRGATLTIQSWAASKAEAAALNEIVKAKMADLAALPNVSSCTLNSDYNYTDTSTKHNRYQALFDIVHFY